MQMKNAFAKLWPFFIPWLRFGVDLCKWQFKNSSKWALDDSMDKASLGIRATGSADREQKCCAHKRSRRVEEEGKSKLAQ
jgi:hypothetical protein